MPCSMVQDMLESNRDLCHSQISMTNDHGEVLATVKVTVQALQVLAAVLND